MINFLEMFLQLDKSDREKCLDLVSNILFPLKAYIIMVVILLFLILCTNIYVISKS